MSLSLRRLPPFSSPMFLSLSLQRQLSGTGGTGFEAHTSFLSSDVGSMQNERRGLRDSVKNNPFTQTNIRFIFHLKNK